MVPSIRNVRSVRQRRFFNGETRGDTVLNWQGATVGSPQANPVFSPTFNNHVCYHCNTNDTMDSNSTELAEGDVPTTSALTAIEGS